MTNTELHCMLERRDIIENRIFLISIFIPKHMCLALKDVIINNKYWESHGFKIFLTGTMNTINPQLQYDKSTDI